MISKSFAVLNKLDHLGWVLVSAGGNIIFLEDVPTTSLMVLRNDAENCRMLPSARIGIGEVLREEAVAHITALLKERESRVDMHNIYNLINACTDTLKYAINQQRVVEEPTPEPSDLPPAFVPKNDLPAIVDRAITAALNRTEDRKQIITMVEQNLKRDTKGPIGYYEAPIKHGENTYCFVTYKSGAWGLRLIDEPYQADAETMTLLEVVDKILARWW